jgi:hypothetical protein
MVQRGGSPSPGCCSADLALVGEVAPKGRVRVAAPPLTVTRHADRLQ